jgi:hypothetical protein
MWLASNNTNPFGNAGGIKRFALQIRFLLDRKHAIILFKAVRSIRIEVPGNYLLLATRYTVLWNQKRSINYRLSFSSSMMEEYLSTDLQHHLLGNSISLHLSWVISTQMTATVSIQSSFWSSVQGNLFIFIAVNFYQEFRFSDFRRFRKIA